MTKKPSKWDKAHNSHLAAYEKQIDAIYAAAAQEAAKIGVSIHDFNPEKLFSFADYPITRKRVDKLLQGLNSSVYACIVNGIKSEWKLSNDKNDELCNKVFAGKEKNLTQSMRRRYYNTNEAARDAFINRKNYGLKLSDRVWRYTNQFKEEIELGLDCGIRDGLAASEMARDLKQYLRNPDKLFRRVRDEHGQLQLSKRAAAYHPGQGVYRSSYKNARRLTVTEGSMAYHSSDYERWQQLDFVVGIEIILSKNHPVPDICDDLKGRYPKDFKFTGWHPHCRCSVLTILKTQEEISKDVEKILAGEPIDGESVNAVTTPPVGFVKWLDENGGRIDEARKRDALPYFIRDNERKGLFKSAFTSRYDEAYVKTMSEHGIIFKENLAERMANSPYNRLDIVRLDDNIQKIFAEQGITDIACTMRASLSGGVHLSWSGTGVELKRSFDIEDGKKVVEHELFELNKELQGNGISRKVFKALYEQYRITGVERIELFANIDIGGYAWARYGFCAKNRSETINAIRFPSLTTKQEKKIMDIINEHFNNSNTHFPMNQIARLPYGKKALLGSRWEGVLDLTDARQRGVFERYLR